MQYFVGWEGGGWNCSRSSESQDALAVLTVQGGSLQIRGKVFRGPIRDDINNCSALFDLLNRKCETNLGCEDEITFAIDTPLGFPLAVQSLVNGNCLPDEVPEDYSRNPYLYRVTEQWLFSQDFPALSAVKDMIGSQATKGMHLLRKLNLKVVGYECGVWRNGRTAAIECYPTTCKRSEKEGYICAGSQLIQQLFNSLEGAAQLRRVDQIDAIHCAFIAYLFATDRSQLVPPTNSPPLTEGWIWIPRDSVGRRLRQP
jgi:hypothetical protein